ncbi:DUF2059 domain-containing protein [Acinetobacter sp. YH12239]|uniref:DUF2059 domain-containing protein n=1 Tax=Acinetobacter sp. YH12239 TaxID=2601166 RepID=UPI0015D3584F|nr:DUF2059 domain-containing protein [Acinetobacter sp. YH12239]
MKILRTLFLSGCIICSPAVMAAQASDQQIEKLIQVLNLDQLLQSTLKQIRPQIDQQAYSIVKNIVKTEKLTPQQQVIANELADKIHQENIKQTSWEKLKPIYLKIYKDVYDAQEVQAQIDFYSSPTGQSILNKGPLVAQESMKILNQQLAGSLQSTEKNFAEVQKKLEQLQKQSIHTDSK